MDLLKEIKEYRDKDDRSVNSQLSYIKQLGFMMMASPRLYKEHVISFCGTLIKLYENLNGDDDSTNKLLKCEEIKCRT